MNSEYALSTYNKDENKLKFDYFLDGHLAISPYKIIAFTRNQKSETIIYSHEPFDKAINIYKKIFINTNITGEAKGTNDKYIDFNDL